MRSLSSSADLFELEPMKYWSLPSGLTEFERQDRINLAIGTNDYLYSLKTDGNLIRAVITPERFALQTRGRGRNTGEFGEIQDKVFWANSVKNAFEDVTVLIGEAYIEGGIDKDVGAVLRSLSKKAIERQTGNNIVRYRIFDCLYYNGENLLNTPLEKRIQYLPYAVEAIKNPLVSCVRYHKANPETFWDKLSNIFANGGEGVVLYKKSMLPCEGRTSAWQTIKVKQIIQNDIDCFVYGTEPAEKDYTGKDIETWQYWINDRTGEKIVGNYYLDMYKGANLTPITKGYYYGWPGAIVCAVYDKSGKPYVLCKCAGLTEEMKDDLRDNYDEWYMRPIKITGMMVSQDGAAVSIRHPKLVSVRDDDIDLKDCSLEKIVGGK